MIDVDMCCGGTTVRSICSYHKDIVVGSTGASQRHSGRATVVMPLVNGIVTPQIQPVIIARDSKARYLLLPFNETICPGATVDMFKRLQVLFEPVHIHIPECPGSDEVEIVNIRVGCLAQTAANGSFPVSAFKHGVEVQFNPIPPGVNMTLTARNCGPRPVDLHVLVVGKVG